MMQNMFFQKRDIIFSSEISAAFALEQIKKLSKNIKIRNYNFNQLKLFFAKYKNFLIFQKLIKTLKLHGWLFHL